RPRFRPAGQGSVFFFSSRRRHTRFSRDWSSDVCSSDLTQTEPCEVAARDEVIPQVARDLPRERTITVGHRAPIGDRAQERHRPRSEERRVGKECRSGWAPAREKKKVKERKR